MGLTAVKIDGKSLVDAFNWLNPIELLKLFISNLRRKPSFKVSLDNKNLRKASALTIGIWVKNLSSIAHNIVRIEGEHEGYTNNFRVSIVDKKYKLPISLGPADPEVFIHLMGEFLHGDPDSDSAYNIIIKVFSRWKGEEVEAGRLKITLN